MSVISFAYLEDDRLDGGLFAPAARDVFARVLGKKAPLFLGHGGVLFPDENGGMRQFAFGPKDYPDKTPETREDAQLLKPLWNIVAKPMRFSNFIPKYVGEVSDFKISTPPSAYVSLHVSQRSLTEAEQYIKQIKAKPVTYRASDANCFTLMGNVAKTVGLDFSQHALGCNVNMPDGALAAFLSLAGKLKKTGDAHFKGIVENKEIEVSFPDRDLFKRARQKFGLCARDPR